MLRYCLAVLIIIFTQNVFADEVSDYEEAELKKKFKPFVGTYYNYYHNYLLFKTAPTNQLAQLKRTTTFTQISIEKNNQDLNLVIRSWANGIITVPLTIPLRSLNNNNKTVANGYMVRFEESLGNIIISGLKKTNSNNRVFTITTYKDGIRLTGAELFSKEDLGFFQLKIENLPWATSNEKSFGLKNLLDDLSLELKSRGSDSNDKTRLFDFIKGHYDKQALRSCPLIF